VVRQGVVVKGLDYSSVRTTAGDLNVTDVQAELKRNEILYGMADPIVQLTGERRTLVFCVSVEHARELCGIINSHKPDSAAHVSGKTPKDERRSIFRQFESGEIQYLLNCQIATEGYDNPGIEVIAMCRPTKSRLLYCQMLGRGFRPLGGILSGIDDPEDRRAAIAASDKKFITVLDFVGACGKHKLVSAVNFLAPDHTEEEHARAEEITNSTGKRIDEALAEARDELTAAALAGDAKLALYRKALIAKSLFTTTAVVDLFDQWKIEARPGASYNRNRRPTPKQLAVLDKAGLIRCRRARLDERDLSFDAASQLITEVMNRRSKGTLTPKQESMLTKYGWPTSLSREECGRVIEAIKADGWQRRGWNQNRLRKEMEL
jgi:superfamily II DNA or RNA helicase